MLLEIMYWIMKAKVYLQDVELCALVQYCMVESFKHVPSDE